MTCSNSPLHIPLSNQHSIQAGLRSNKIDLGDHHPDLWPRSNPNAHQRANLTRAADLPARKERSMKTNVGGLDRILRIAVGLILIALTLAGTIGAWGWLGLIPLATGLFRTCPLYSLIGMNTCPVSDRGKD
jgi:hypothetical protein